MTVNIFNISASLIALTGVLFVWEFGLRPLMLDNFRDEVFMIRDRLYALSQSGDIDCNSQAYRTVEQFLNGTIRYAHRFSLLSFVLAMRFYKRNPEQDPIQASKKLDSLIATVSNTHVRDELRLMINKVLTLLPGYIALSSLPFIACTLIYLVVRRFVPEVVEKKQDAVSTFQAEAIRNAKLDGFALA